MLPPFDYDLFLEAWKTFIHHQIVLPEVNPFVAQSWKRCLPRLNPRSRVYPNKLSPENLLAAQVVSFDLISLARPIIEDIYQFVEGTDTVILLTNSASYVLDMLGDVEMYQVVEDFGIQLGALVSEGVIGTNAFALAIHEGVPARVVGPEHYLEQFHELAGAAAPIFDLTGRPLGAIGVVNLASQYHPHSLGLVVAGARAIEGQHQSDLLLAEQHSQMAQLNAIIEASANGLLVLDERGVLMHINKAATRIIGLPREVVLGRNIDELVQYPGFLNEAVTNRDPITDVEFTLQLGQRRINCVISLNYVLKEGTVRWVIATLRQEEDVRELIHQQVGSQAPLTLEDIPGASAPIRRVQRFVKVAAPAQASILIRGESGTGKNVLASAIHNASPRSEGPFLIVGCTSIPHEWVVSELLGYDENLDRKKPGGRPSKFELAHGGTLFFQNIDDLPLEAQAILLNVLDLGIVQRLGSERPIEVNVRVIASTSANIEKLIAQGNFRADLYYRLSSFEITLPTLRERMEDLPVLVTRIMARISRQLDRNFILETGVLELLSQYAWPGNVRELEAVLGRAAAQAGPTGIIVPLLLPVHIQNPGDHFHAKRTPEIQPLYKLERESILQAAEACKGNASEMAKLLGIGRTTLWRRLKEMNIELAEYRYRSEIQG